MQPESTYKKTYTLLALSIIGLVPCLILLVKFTELLRLEEAIVIKTLLWLTLLWIVGLFYLICKTQNVYWINGVRFEEAKEAGEERRRAYGLKHLNLFAKAWGIYTVYGVFSLILSLPSWLDVVCFMLLTVGAAIRTIGYKL